jgi:UDP-glucose 4-epimerase
VYGDTAELPVHEDTRLNPLSPYAADKLAGEHYLFFYARKYGLSATAFRFFNIYGPRQDPSSPYSGVISIFVDRVRAGQPVVLFGDGEQTRDFVYVQDLIDILCAALHDDRADGQIINVGRGIECSLQGMLDELERLSGKSIERRHEPARVGDIRRSCANVARLRQVLDRVPMTELGTGLGVLLEESRR